MTAAAGAGPGWDAVAPCPRGRSGAKTGEGMSLASGAEADRKANKRHEMMLKEMMLKERVLFCGTRAS